MEIYWKSFTKSTQHADFSRIFPQMCSVLEKYEKNITKSTHRFDFSIDFPKRPSIWKSIGNRKSNLRKDSSLGILIEKFVTRVRGSTAGP